MLVCCWMSRALTGDWPSPAPPPPLPLPRPHQPHAEADDAWGQPPVKAVPHRPRRGTATYFGWGRGEGLARWLWPGAVCVPLPCHDCKLHSFTSEDTARNTSTYRRSNGEIITDAVETSVGRPTSHPSIPPSRTGQGGGGEGGGPVLESRQARAEDRDGTRAQEHRPNRGGRPVRAGTRTGLGTRT